MSENRRKMIVFATLGLAVVWALFNLGGESDNPEENHGLATIQSLAPGSPMADSSRTQVAIDTGKLMATAWGIDPLRSASSPNRQIAPVLSWKLTGIMFSASEPVAYLNQKVVKVGDWIDNAEVIEIEKQTVTIKFNDKLITLSVSKG